ncbi:MAG: lipid-binding SYLF domain-containing protein [Deltaproteobacteria bacterium]|nr:lipid-binding SYLF domain-containing protein [Deltaproteobacteria bacterium]
MKKTKIFSILVVVFALASIQAQAFNIERRVGVSRSVLIQRMTSANPIPRYLLDQAECIAVTRNVKAGFIFGGEGSTGLVSCRTSSGWSAPSFLNTAGVSFGLLIGGQVVDNVLLFMTPLSRQMLNRANLTLGGDLSLAVGPYGEGVGTNVSPLAHILVYSAGTGLYAGFSLNGTLISHGDERNRLVYGKYLTAGEILSTPGMLASPLMRQFVDVLEAYAPTGVSR